VSGVPGMVWLERHPPRLSATERHRQIQEVAVDLFARHGYRTTTMEDVARAAGVGKALVYQHFGSKRGLYLEVVRQVAADMYQEITGAVASADGPREQVEQGLAAYFRLVVTQETAFRLLFGREAGGDDELEETVRQSQDVIVEAISPLLAQAVPDAVHRRILAYCLVGMAEGVSREWIAERERRDPLDPVAAGAEAELLAQRVAQVAWAGLRSLQPG
jgi:AcrR family transcriptional regulator